MPHRARFKARTIRATRVRRTSGLVADTPPPVTELSNYEMLERRSRELEAERAQGGCGTAQPPDAEKPLLFPTFCTMKQTQSRQRHPTSGNSTTSQSKLLSRTRR
jgi:hypothetical protein